MFDKGLLKLPGIKGALLALIGFSILEGICILGQAFGLSRALGHLWEGETFSQIAQMAGLFCLSFLCVRLVLNARELYISHIAYRTTSRLRRELLNTIFRHGAPAVQDFGTGTTAAMVLEGIDKVQSYLELVLPKLIDLVVLPVMFAIAITLTDWVSGVVVIIMLPAMILLMVLIGRSTAERGRTQHANFRMMSNHFVDSVRGIRTLNTFKVSQTYGQRVFEVSERFREATLKMLRMATLSGAVLDLFATMALAAVSIMLGLRLIDHSLVIIPALFVLILTPEYFRPIREFASDYHASLDGVNSLKTIKSIIEASDKIPPSVALPPWRESSSLMLDHVSKRYGTINALDDISLKLDGYQCIGIIGKSGSGKSTLLKILAGLEDPTSGIIEFETNRTDGTLRHSDWQHQVAYIPQEPYIFHATLRENLTFYNPHARDEEIVEAISEMGLGSLVEELPHGLNSVIGEGGRGLSGGQAQRIALARVFLDSKRNIVLFDEPTAHLDIETEYELKDAMRKLMKRKLVVFATHRLHWLDTFDQLIILENGQIVDQGTLEHLRKTSKRFYSMIFALRGDAA